MDIAGAFQKLSKVVKTFFYSGLLPYKLTRAVATSKTTAKLITNHFIDHWLIPYGISTNLLTGNGTQFVSIFLETACTLLELKPQKNTACHLNTSAQDERINKTILTGPQHPSTKHQKHWDNSFQLLTSTYNTQVRRSKKHTLFSIVHGLQPSGPTLKQTVTALPTKDYAKMSSQITWSKLEARIRTMRAEADANMDFDLQRLMRNYNQQVRVVTTSQPSDGAFIN